MSDQMDKQRIEHYIVAGLKKTETVDHGGFLSIIKQKVDKVWQRVGHFYSGWQRRTKLYLRSRILPFLIIGFIFILSPFFIQYFPVITPSHRQSSRLIVLHPIKPSSKALYKHAIDEEKKKKYERLRQLEILMVLDQSIRRINVYQIDKNRFWH